MDTLIRCKNLTKIFKKRVVLNNINLDIKRGEIFGIIGMSCSGKTTLLKTLIGFLEPNHGDILFYSEKGKQYKPIHKNQLEVRKTFGFATQMPSFYPKLTVEENLLHFGSLYNQARSKNKTNAKHLLDLTTLSNAKDILAQNLSGGMEKRLSIACSLIHNPKVLILDEPTADLDPLSRQETWALIKEINKKGTTIIIASHFLAELELVCDRVGILYNNHLIVEGTPEKIKSKFFKNQEIHLCSKPGDYSTIAKALKRYHSLNIEKTAVKDRTLVIHTPKAEKTLHHTIHILERIHEDLISIEVRKPSLTEIFETLKNK